MPSSPRRIQLRRPDRCVACLWDLSAGEAAVWDPARREVRCLDCGSRPASDVLLSTAGASARRQYERRRDRREERVRGRLGPLAGAWLLLADEPSHQQAWEKGAEAEEWLARELELRTREAGVVLLHDRRIPGSRANIDHMAVGPAGVFVIDAKRYWGRIAVRRRGGLFSERTEHLMVGGRDRSTVLDGMERQTAAVRKALAAHPDVPVTGVLCFVDGDWPLFGTLQARGIPVLPPRKAAKLCSGPGPLDREAVGATATILAQALVAA